jgi:putative transposase
MSLAVPTKNPNELKELRLAKQSDKFWSAMQTSFRSFVSLLRTLFETRSALHLECVALRHQVNVLRRCQRGRLPLNRADRLFWVWLSKFWSDWRSVLLIVKPETVIGWHRKGFRLYWSWKSKHCPGRTEVSAEVRDLIRDMSMANPLWGAPRIHGELLKLGIDLSETTVAKYIVRQRRPPSQSWRAFSKNHVQELVSVHLFLVLPGKTAMSNG